MKLSEWARQAGVDYRTARRWVKADVMPVPWVRLETGTILVGLPEHDSSGRTVAYARVSSHDQKADLDRQVARIAQSGHPVDEYVTEVGSAMNGVRPRLRKVLSDPKTTTIIVEHRDRLTRFGFGYIEAALAGRGGKIVVLDDAEVEDDLVRDMTEVLTSFCARLYGRRGAANRARRAVEEACQAPA